MLKLINSTLIKAQRVVFHGVVMALLCYAVYESEVNRHFSTLNYVKNYTIGAVILKDVVI